MILDAFLDWAEAEPNVRLAVLSGSRADLGLGGERGTGDDPAHGPDLLSDYDIALFVRDPRPLLISDTWFESFAPVLVVEKPHVGDDFFVREGPTRLVVYLDQPRVDFSVLPLDRIESDLCVDPMPDDYNIGYRVLVDKDDWTTRLTPPTGLGFVPRQPTAEDYALVVNDFWWETTAAAKYLWRGLLLAARFYMDHELRYSLIRKMLEWYLQIQGGWTLNTGQFAKQAQHLLPPDEWRELAATFTGPDPDENWEALFRLANFFRRIARRVGAEFGYPYPEQLDRDVSAYLNRIREGRVGGES